jgi:hypothetical protein
MSPDASFDISNCRWRIVVGGTGGSRCFHQKQLFDGGNVIAVRHCGDIGSSRHYSTWPRLVGFFSGGRHV